MFLLQFRCLILAAPQTLTTTVIKITLVIKANKYLKRSFGEELEACATDYFTVTGVKTIMTGSIILHG